MCADADRGPSLDLYAPRIWLHALSLDEARLVSLDPGAFAMGLGVRCAKGWPTDEMRGALAQGALAPAGEHGFGVWVVIERSEATVVGDIGFHGSPDKRGRAEIGYAISPAWQRRGYATDAVAVLLEWARNVDGVSEVAARTALDNMASQSVLRRLHFRVEEESGGEILWLSAAIGVE